MDPKKVKEGIEFEIQIEELEARVVPSETVLPLMGPISPEDSVPIGT